MKMSVLFKVAKKGFKDALSKADRSTEDFLGTKDTSKCKEVIIGTEEKDSTY